MLTPPQAEPQQISETGAAPPDESVNGATGGTGAARRKSHDASPVDPTDPSKSRRNSTHSSRPGVSSRPPRSVPFGGGASPSSSVLAKAKSNHAFGSSMNAAHASQSAPHRQPSRDLPLPLARQKSPKKETSLPLPPGRRRGSQSSEKSEGLRHASGRAPAPSGGSGALMGPPQSAASSRPKTMRAKSMGIGLNSPSEKEKEKGHHGGTNAASSSTASAAAKRAADLQRARTQSLGERHKQKRASEGGGSPSTVAAAAAAASSAMSPASSAVSPSSHQRQRSSMRKPSIVKDGPTSPTLSPSAERPHKVSFPDEREGSDTVRHRPGPFSPSNQGAKSGEPSSSSVLGRSGAADSQGSVPGSASRFSQGRSPSSGMARHASRVSSALETMQEVENEDEDEEDEGEKGDKRLGRSAAASSAYGRGPPNNASYFSSMGKTGTQSSFAESRPPGSRKGSMRGSNIIKKPIKGAKSTVFVSPGIESRRNSEEEDDDESGGMNSSQQSQQIEEGEEVGDDSSNEERSSEFTDGSVFYGRGKSSMSEIDMAALGATFGQLPGLRKSNKSDTAKSITKSVTSALSRANTGKSGMSQSGRDDRPNFKAQASRAESGKSFSRAVSVAESSVAPASLGGGPVALGGERASIGFSGQGFVGLGANRRRSSMTSGVLSQPRGSVGNIASLGLGGIDEEGAPSHSLNPALDLEALRGLGGGRGDRSARPSVASGVGGPPGAGGRVRRASMFAGDMAHGGMGGNLGFAGPVGQGVPQSGIGFGPGVGKSSNVGLGIPGGLGVPGQGKASEAKIGRMMTMRMDITKNKNEELENENMRLASDNESMKKYIQELERNQKDYEHMKDNWQELQDSETDLREQVQALKEECDRIKESKEAIERELLERDSEMARQNLAFDRARSQLCMEGMSEEEVAEKEAEEQARLKAHEEEQKKRIRRAVEAEFEREKLELEAKVKAAEAMAEMQKQKNDEKDLLIARMKETEEELQQKLAEAAHNRRRQDTMNLAAQLQRAMDDGMTSSYRTEPPNLTDELMNLADASSSSGANPSRHSVTSSTPQTQADKDKHVSFFGKEEKGAESPPPGSAGMLTKGMTPRMTPHQSYRDLKRVFQPGSGPTSPYQGSPSAMPVRSVETVDASVQTVMEPGKTRRVIVPVQEKTEYVFQRVAPLKKVEELVDENGNPMLPPVPTPYEEDPAFVAENQMAAEKEKGQTGASSSSASASASAPPQAAKAKAKAGVLKAKSKPRPGPKVGVTFLSRSQLNSSNGPSKDKQEKDKEKELNDASLTAQIAAVKREVAGWRSWYPAAMKALNTMASRLEAAQRDCTIYKQTKEKFQKERDELAEQLEEEKKKLRDVEEEHAKEISRLEAESKAGLEEKQTEIDRLRWHEVVAKKMVDAMRDNMKRVYEEFAVMQNKLQEVQTAQAEKEAELTALVDVLNAQKEELEAELNQLRRQLNEQGRSQVSQASKGNALSVAFDQVSERTAVSPSRAASMQLKQQRLGSQHSAHTVQEDLESLIDYTSKAQKRAATFERRLSEAMNTVENGGSVLSQSRATGIIDRLMGEPSDTDSDSKDLKGLMQGRRRSSCEPIPEEGVPDIPQQPSDMDMNLHGRLHEALAKIRELEARLAGGVPSVYHPPVSPRAPPHLGRGFEWAGTLDVTSKAQVQSPRGRHMIDVDIKRHYFVHKSLTGRKEEIRADLMRSKSPPRPPKARIGSVRMTGDGADSPVASGGAASPPLCSTFRSAGGGSIHQETPRPLSRPLIPLLPLQLVHPTGAPNSGPLDEQGQRRSAPLNHAAATVLTPNGHHPTTPLPPHSHFLHSVRPSLCPMASLSPRANAILFAPPLRGHSVVPVPPHASVFTPSPAEGVGETRRRATVSAVPKTSARSCGSCGGGEGPAAANSSSMPQEGVALRGHDEGGGGEGGEGKEGASCLCL